MTEPLSPAAQAVLDAANGTSSYGPDDCLNDARWIAAAALRALADAVVPEENSIVTVSDFRRQRQHTRKQILSIATELENHD
jgi:hypothetical protein